MVLGSNPEIIIQSHSVLQINTPNTQKSDFFQTWVGFGAIFLFIDYFLFLVGIRQMERVLEEIWVLVFLGGLNLIPVWYFFRWLLTKQSYLFLDRAKGKAVIRMGDELFDFPWRSIQFDVKWLPTKLGGVNFLSLLARPPFPDSIIKKNGKRFAKSDAVDLLLPLGGFDCRNAEVARAYIRFFSDFMESNEEPLLLYQSTVGSVY